VPVVPAPLLVPAAPPIPALPVVPAAPVVPASPEPMMPAAPVVPPLPGADDPAIPPTPVVPACPAAVPPFPALPLLPVSPGPQAPSATAARQQTRTRIDPLDRWGRHIAIWNSRAAATGSPVITQNPTRSIDFRRAGATRTHRFSRRRCSSPASQRRVKRQHRRVGHEVQAARRKRIDRSRRSMRACSRKSSTSLRLRRRDRD
jgi:hypothetical protein